MARKKRADDPRDAHIHALARYPRPPIQDRSRESALKIVDAAEHVLLTQGIQGFTMAAVAAQGGLSVGGIYRRFTNKEDLLYVVQDLALQRARERFEGALTRTVFSSAEAAAAAVVAGLCAGLGGEEALHCALMAAGTEAASLIRRGLESRARAFQGYRLIMLPHLQRLDKELANKLVVISWEIAMGGVMNKITTHSAELREMPWSTFQSELTSAVTAYLHAHMSQSSD